MAIKKQEFYEGAALHQLARVGAIAGIRYQPPFFLLNDRLLVRLKHSTKGRSPWGFTFTGDEQRQLQDARANCKIVIGLICGGDGVVALSYESLLRVAGCSNAAIRIACVRKHGKHYEVKGPDGTHDKKIAPSNWLRILDL